QRMGVDADKKRPGESGFLAVIADGLSRCQDVILVEGISERRATVPRCAEGDALRGIGRIGFERKIGSDEFRDVRQRVGSNQLAGGGIWSGHVNSFSSESLTWVATRRVRDRVRRSGSPGCARIHRSSYQHAEFPATPACRGRRHGPGAGPYRDYLT